MTIETDRVRATLDYRFPTGSLRVQPHEDWLARDCIGALPADDNRLHPTWALIGALRGLGVDLSELFSVIGATPGDGVMFGETEIEQVGPFEVGRTYLVRGRLSTSNGDPAGAPAASTS